MKVRADQLLLQRGLVTSRSEAQSLILAGRVFRAKGRIDKAGMSLDPDEAVRIEETARFVSRGGLKLEGALSAFKIDVTDKVCLDVGASTGGFTDCLLQRGARKVYAVDVGYGQFHHKLRKDPRIVLFEKTNFRWFDRSRIPEPVDLAVVDVSFISLSKILPKVKEVLGDGGLAVVLVKPQFELGPKEVKKGVVRSEALREKALLQVVRQGEREGFSVRGKIPSPIRGPKGNQEWLLYLAR